MAKENKKNQPEDQELEELTELPEEEVQEEAQIPESKEAPAEAQEVKTEEAVPQEEEAKLKRKKKEEEEIVEEKFYTIPLQKALVRPPKKRSPRAMQLVRAYVTKHMKVEMKVTEEEEEEELPTLTIAEEVNEKVWDKGIEKPPRRIRVRATKDKDGNVKVYLAENQ